MLPLTQFKKLDVRPLVARGRKPYPVIRKRVDALKPSEGLIVVAPFLPSVLVKALGEEGFRSKVERGSGCNWIVYFWREQLRGQPL